MSTPFMQQAFTLGEASPSLFGRTDLARYKVGASTMRNMWPRFSGGAYSRAGTAFVGFSKQTGRTFAPRLVPFQFNINQGLALEFGDHYLRIISDGALVTEGPLPVLGITRANPAVLTTASSGVQSATPILTGVTRSYAPGDQITLGGGAPAIPAVLRVTNTELLSTRVLTAGTLYVPGDTINVFGGVQTVSAILTVATTQVVSATIAAAGAGGTDGQQTVTGTTGTGTLFTALVNVVGGVITAVVSIATGGSYTVEPTVLANEPVTGAALVGAQLALVMGVHTVTVSTPGTFTTNPTNGALTQSASSGAGTGASFNMSVLGPRTVSVVDTGSYPGAVPNPASQQSTTGIGIGVQFNIVSFSTQPYANGDWVVINDVGGMTQVNGRTFVAANATATTIELTDVYGNNINSTAYGAFSGGGTVSRIYTAVTPYAEEDLPWLKWTQSKDVMSICCVNQLTNVSYQPQDLTRHTDSNWTFAPVSPHATIAAPTGVVTSFSAGGASTYGYIVTAVNSADGSEGLGSAPVFAQNAVDIYATAGTITVSWAAVEGASSYSVYQAAISFSGPQPAGTPYGLVASGIKGTSWQNSNLLPDFVQTPPTFENPFAGPAEYPGTVSYFQQRRMYAYSVAEPDTYHLSVPGSFTNFNTRTPPVSDDAITGAPWVQQVNGVQFIIDMPGGAVVLTGREAWQLTGTGGSSFNPQPVTPTTQQAQPQAFNGCSSHVPPIRIDYDILYVQAKGSIVRDLNYSFTINIYTGSDITLNSSHLFNLYQIQEWCWAEEPYKLVWAVRTDGALLSCTFLKPEQICGWARHDTQGSWVTVCSVTEPPVDAVYLGAQRIIGDNTAYTIERMDNRLWSSVDEAWCVDCGNALFQPQPDATLMIGSAGGLGAIGTMTVTNGGSGWSAATTITVIDDNGAGDGTGAVVTPTIVGGVITGLTGGGGTNYSSPQFYAIDPAGSDGGSGFAATCDLTNTVTLLTSGDVFSPGDVGSVIRAAGGVAMITAYNGMRSVTADVIVPFTGVIPVSSPQVSITPTESFTPVSSGNWSMTAPVSTVTGLNYFAGASVVGVADGQPFGPLTVSQNGTIDLPMSSSNVVVGLSFLPQLQSLYLDTGNSPTSQGQRKKAAAVTVRVENSRAFEAGSNQVDGSTLSPPQIGPVWRNMTAVPDLGVAPYGTSYVPLGTGDVRVPLQGGFTTKAQVAVQQPNPLPLDVLAFVTEDESGDPPQTGRAPKQQSDMVGA